MKRLVTLICCFTALSLYAKQSTFLYFEDKNGLKDSLEIAIGLTDDEIAAILRLTNEEVEQNMLDSTHWVWLWDYTTGQERDYLRVYAYKPYGAMIEYGRKEIYMPANRLPVTIKWDQQFFIDNELTGSVMSDMRAWFDAVCGDESLYSVRLSMASSSVLNDTYRGVLWCTYDCWNELILKHVGISLGTFENLKEKIDLVADEKQVVATKRIKDGQLLIDCNGKTYNAQGAEIK